MTLQREFVDYSVGRLTGYMSRIETCVSKLTAEQLWERGSANENAVGNLLLHLEGNVRQWIMHGVGGQPDVRVRAAEFAAQGGASAAELLAKLRTCVEEAVSVIQSVPEDGFLKRIVPQGDEVTVLAAIYQVVQHFAGHTFQIMYATKRFTHEDLGFSARWSTPK